MQRHDVASTLRRRCINVMCPLGKEIEGAERVNNVNCPVSLNTKLLHRLPVNNPKINIGIPGKATITGQGPSKNLDKN